jgi:hypothetical protein
MASEVSMAEQQDRREGWGTAFPERRSGDGRRDHPRLHVALAARGSGSKRTVMVRELSVGGLFLEEDLGLLDGDPIDFELLVPGSDTPVRVAGTVTRPEGEGRGGQGVRFGRMAPSDCRVIESYLDRVRREG